MTWQGRLRKAWQSGKISHSFSPLPTEQRIIEDSGRHRQSNKISHSVTPPPNSRAYQGKLRSRELLFCPASTSLVVIRTLSGCTWLHSPLRHMNGTKTFWCCNFSSFIASGRLKVNMGNIYFKQKNYPKAIKFYRMALDQVPNTHRSMRYDQLIQSCIPRFCNRNPVQLVVTELQGFSISSLPG